MRNRLATPHTARAPTTTAVENLEPLFGGLENRRHHLSESVVPFVLQPHEGVPPGVVHGGPVAPSGRQTGPNRRHHGDAGESQRQRCVSDRS